MKVVELVTPVTLWIDGAPLRADLSSWGRRLHLVGGIEDAVTALAALRTSPPKVCYVEHQAVLLTKVGYPEPFYWGGQGAFAVPVSFRPCFPPTVRLPNFLR